MQTISISAVATVTMEVPGDPRGKGSVRVGKWGAYKDEKTENYMGTCILFMRRAWAGRPAIEAPSQVDIVAVLRRPKSLIPRAKARTPQPPAGEFAAPCKPDPDNIAKGALDSLVQAGVLVDDCRVVALSVRKVYAAVGSEPCLRVSVREFAG